jgi:hypothetical protein
MLTPVFYVTILHIVERRRARVASAEVPATEATIHA